MKEIRQPWLVQRGYFNKEGKIRYEYMGSAEFEMGPYATIESQRSILAEGLESGMATVVVNIEKGVCITGKDEKRETKVFMIAGKGFDFSGYAPWLQKMADDEIRLKHYTNFCEASQKVHGIIREDAPSWRHDFDTCIWLDTQNDVFWTLTQENNDKLLAKLEEIRQEWQKKGVFETPSPFRK
jgi:hypothetical protein